MKTKFLSCTKYFMLFVVIMHMRFNLAQRAVDAEGEVVNSNYNIFLKSVIFAVGLNFGE